MATKISNLPSAIASAVGDLFAMVQAGVTRKVTLSQIADWIINTSLSFVQSGTGAISASLQAYLRYVRIAQGWIPTNLWDGIADGSNTTDLATYVQAALDACAAKDLRFPAGTYLIGTVVT